MLQFRSLSTSEQLAEYLREKILRGTFGQTLPGTDALVETMSVSRKTVVAAVKQLEREGFVESAGQGRSRRISLPRNRAARGLRVGILLYVKDDRKSDYMLELLHQLHLKGHHGIIAKRTLTDLKMDVKRVVRFVQDTPVDAWIVVAGSSHILQWFSEQATPAFALFGRQPSIDIAATGPRKSEAMEAVAQRLVELGHRRIVLLTREERRKPSPGRVERVFLDKLRALGIEVGPYNLPDWEDSPAGLERCLTSLFRLTPPTALFAQQIEIFDGMTHFLLREGFRVPRDVSVICADPCPSFSWCTPTVAHISYDSSDWIKQIMRWVDKVGRGVNERRQVLYPARFVDGGSIGPARQRDTRATRT